MAGKYRFIGHPTVRKDAVEIVTGRAKFGIDEMQPGMLFGKVLRSPHPHAIIRTIDTTKARALTGVEAVLTHKDVPDWKFGSPRHLRMLDSKVRYVGDAVALIAARSVQIAEEALDLIDVEYEELPAVYDVEESIKSDAPQLYPEIPGNVFPLGFPLFGPRSLREIVMGDVQKGFAEADVIAEGAYAYENITNPLPPEPPGVIAAWDGPQTVILWASPNGTFLEKAFLQSTIGKHISVRIHGGLCGGSYGSRSMSQQIMLYAVALARAAGKPVKLTYTKEEQLATYILRLGSRIHCKVGLKRDGTVTAISGEWLVDTGFACISTQGQIAVGCGEAQLMLRCPNWDLKPKLVCTNRPMSGIVRGYGGQELKSALIPALTHAMEQAGLDPVEFFKKNYVRPGDGYYWRDGNWWVSRGVDFTPAMEKGAQDFGWRQKWKGWLRPTAVHGTKRTGVGVGVHGNADVGEDASEAYVRLEADGSAVLYSPIADHGTGQISSLCKMVAEVLQLPLDRVRIAPHDPLVGPYEFGPVGSRGTWAIGSAVIGAAEDARRKLFELAAPKLNAAPEDLDTVDGLIFSKKEPDVKIPWKAGLGFDRTCLGYGRFDPDFTMPNFMMVFVEVEVDVETGETRLLRVQTATDVGQVIDPLCLGNQLDSCLGSAGIDSALTEETILDRSTGRILSTNMIDYKWRTFAELPAMQHTILETPFASHRFGAIGVGEIAPAPGPSAVLMAVSNAIGIRVHDYPLSPDRILRALGKVKDTKPKRSGA